MSSSLLSGFFPAKTNQLKRLDTSITIRQVSDFVFSGPVQMRDVVDSYKLIPEDRYISVTGVRERVYRIIDYCCIFQ